ncbi:SusC/RagA family TonB-linked outer membrane protein, partial [Flavobacteriaceae bacterium]|nr:SusC/RagA family TonB-linked outer membrane protein [Flavobacteriaceae bacterium]
DALDARGLGEYLYLADYYAGKTPSHGQYGFSGTPENPQISIPNYVFPSGAASVDESLYSLTESNIYAITKSADTNWWELLTQANAPMSQHSIDASGATETSQYAFNATFFSQDAVIKYQGYKRATIRLNSSTKTLGDRLEVGENFTLSLDNRFGGFGNDGEQNAVSGAYKHHPLLPNYDIAGNFAGSRGLNLGNNYNPYASQFRNQDDRTRRSRAFGNVYAQLTIAEDFKFKSSFGVNLTTNQVKDIGRPQPEYVEGNFINSQRSATSWDYEWTWTNTLSWAKVLNDVHDVSAYVGVEAIEGFGEYFGASRQRFPFQSTNIISYLDLGNQGTAGNYGNISKDFSLWSQFVQANYQYDGKYLAQVTVRNDASSRFKSATNSAFFPAFSLGWRMSEENFMSGISFIDDLKFRYGWGKTGNQSIGDYNAFTQFRSSSYNSGYPIDGSSSSATLGYDPSQFGNPNAKWEATVSNNFGFDATLFDRAISVEFDLWNRTTSDLLLTVPVVYSAGDAGAPAVNVGEMYNEGIDFAMDWTKDVGELQITLGGNISSYRNEVKKLDEFDTPIFGSNRRVPALTRTAVGDPISSIYGFEVLGIFQSQAEADAWAPYGSTGYNAPGKFKYADINGDGEINDDDRTIIGNPHPDFVYGINLNLAYRNFNLNIFGNGVQGNDVYNYVRYFADFNTFQGNRSTRALTEAWQPSNPSAPRAQWTAANPNATSPIMDANDQISSRTSSYLIEDASYFRLRNIQLTYSFDDAINTALGISGGQIYLQGQNLFTITNYSGLNPEIQTGNDIQLGYDGGFMPVSKTLIVGLNISLF